MSEELPEGWAETTVGEVAEDISYGYTAKATNSTSGPRYLRITDIQNNAVNWRSVPSCNIPAGQIAAYELRKGDLVFARTGATTGKSFLITACPEAIFASYLIRVRSGKAVVPEFLAVFFQSASYWDQISENISGSAQPNCNATKLSSLTLPIPPFAEQERITEKLEALLAKVDTCQQRLAKVPPSLKRFRQAVLEAACSGRLTEDWRQKDREITKSAELVDTDYEAPSSWKSARLVDLAKFIDYRGRTPKKVESGMPLITAKNIRPGYIDREPREFMRAAEYDSWMTRGIPRIGDVLITTEAPLGYVAAVDIREKFALAQRVICLQFHEPQNQQFALIFMMSPVFQSKLAEQATGTTVSGIKASRLKELSILLPPCAEQQEIAHRVEKLFVLADQIEERFAEAKKRVDSITQSILAKAFRGELVPTEYELAKAEGRSFESAEELLKRIKGNGKTQEKTPKRPVPIHK